MRNAKVANYEVHESFMVETKDREDHTFSGIMFAVKCKQELPVDVLKIDALWVRGMLGHMTVSLCFFLKQFLFLTLCSAGVDDPEHLPRKARD